MSAKYQMKQMKIYSGVKNINNNREEVRSCNITDGGYIDHATILK